MAIQWTENTDIGVLPIGNGLSAIVVANPSGTLTDRSGTITTGGTSQTVANANASRKYLLVQNNSTGALWVGFGAGAAVQNQRCSSRLLSCGQRLRVQMSTEA